MPLLEIEAVQKRGWLTSEELVEYYAVSQVIPGLNIPDVSMFIGYKLRGKMGAIVAGLAIVTVPFLLILFISLFLSAISTNPLVKGALWGIEIGSIIVLISAVRMIWNKSVVDGFSFIFFIFIFIFTAFTEFSPVWVVVIALILGVVRGFLIEKNEVSE